MGMGNAFAALTEGWFGGVNQRHAWEDRADKKKRQEKLDAYYDEEFGWRREENDRAKTRFGWETAEQADADRARDLIFADDQSRRADGKAAIAAADARHEAELGIRPAGVSTKSPVATVAAEPATQAASAPQARATSERTLPAEDRATAPNGLLLPPLDPSGRPYAIEPGEAQGEASQVEASRPAPVARVAEDRTTPAPAAQPQRGGHVPNAEAQRRLAEAQAMDVVTPAERDYPYSPDFRDRDLITPGGRRGAEVQAPAAEAQPASAPDAPHVYGQSGGLVPDVKEGAKAAGRSILDVAKDTAGLAANSIRKSGERIISPINAALDYGLGIKDAIPNPPVGETVEGRLMEGAGAAGNAILDAFVGGASKPAKSEAIPAADPKKPETQEAATAAAATLEQTPSGQAVAATAKSMGVSPTTKHPTEKRERIVGSWMDHFISDGVPKIVRGMMERGEFDAAQQMLEWAETSGAKTGLRHWANAGLAASIGDFDAFADNLAAAYNAPGYFDDGYSMVREKSDFIRTPEGDVAGAIVTLRDDATGQEFQQRFDSADDLLQVGIQLLSPEAVMQHQMQQQAAQTEALKAAAEAAQAEAKEMEKRIDGIAKTIFDSANKNALPGEEGMSYAEARAQAAAVLGLDVPGPAGGAAIYARVPE